MADLERFVSAQALVYPTVLAELREGQKQSHWMWFIFPQLVALGRSPTAKFYGIAGMEEARAYLAHELLGPRLAECTELVNAMTGRSAREIFGTPDDLKFRSSLTLCAAISDHGSPFHRAIDKYYAGEFDKRTVELLAAAS